MSKRLKFALAGSMTSIISGWMCIWALSLTIELARIVDSLVVQTPSLLVIGLVVGVTAEHLQVGLWPTVAGAAIGWIVGSLVAAYLFLPPGLRAEQISALFYLAQMLIGAMAGLLPVLIARLLKTQET